MSCRPCNSRIGMSSWAKMFAASSGRAEPSSPACQGPAQSAEKRISSTRRRYSAIASARHALAEAPLTPRRGSAPGRSPASAGRKVRRVGDLVRPAVEGIGCDGSTLLEAIHEAANPLRCGQGQPLGEQPSGGEAEHVNALDSLDVEQREQVRHDCVPGVLIVAQATSGTAAAAEGRAGAPGDGRPGGPAAHADMCGPSLVRRGSPTGPARPAHRYSPGTGPPAAHPRHGHDSRRIPQAHPVRPKPRDDSAGSGRTR